MSKLTYVPCSLCSKKATWCYMPGVASYCDSCVPRGCSCNEDESGVEELDEQGRKSPCCEYWDLTDEDHNDTALINRGWKEYYKNNPEKEYEEYSDQYKECNSRVPMRKRNVSKSMDFTGEAKRRKRDFKRKMRKNEQS